MSTSLEYTKGRVVNQHVLALRSDVIIYERLQASRPKYNKREGLDLGLPGGKSNGRAR